MSDSRALAGEVLFLAVCVYEAEIEVTKRIAQIAGPMINFTVSSPSECSRRASSLIMNQCLWQAVQRFFLIAIYHQTLGANPFRMMRLRNDSM
jgi:hypothetical protein